MLKPLGEARSLDPVDRCAAELERKARGSITGTLKIPATEGTYGDIPHNLDPALAKALRKRGISRLYSHQAQAWDVVQRGENLVVVTPTASGKTLCYNLPIIDAVRRTRAKALYLFPTKALSQDQVAELMELNAAAELGVRVFTYDGDTPGDARKAVRKHGDVVVSNPDMIHQGILPHHTRWARFFEGLRYVVVDEAHIYRGCFGAHVANVIRRLMRIAAFYGSRPQFILSSATIGNPDELARTLIGQPVTAIVRSGAPQGERTVMLWNPPMVNPELGIRASARSQTARITKTAVSNGERSIVLAKTRTMVEVLTRYLKDAFDADRRRPPRVKAYRGGYLPNERRGTEKALRQGDVDCVIATSALELGVDIGALDVCVLNGYPGTIAATWQRFGRAGRRQRPALGVLVASSDPLDQYVVRHPEFFLGASPESARVDPNQMLIALEHIRCAAFELPFNAGEAFGNLEPSEYLAYLAEEEVVHLEGDKWHWMAESYPANSVSLRSVADGNFVVVDTTGGKSNIIAEVDYSGAAMTLYEGAIYLIQAKPWQVERLDWEGRKAYVRETHADYFTEAIDYTKLKILERFEGHDGKHLEHAHGEVHVIRRVSGYKKIRYYTHENVGYGDVDLPDYEMHTTAVWWRLGADALASVFDSNSLALDGFQGAAHALHNVAALRMMCEPGDLGRAVGTGEGEWGAGRTRNREQEARVEDNFEPTIFLYDNYPGGMGIAEPLHAQGRSLVEQASQLVKECECSFGCPGCVGPVLASEEHDGKTPKWAALKVLELIEADSADNGKHSDSLHVETNSVAV